MTVNRATSSASSRSRDGEGAHRIPPRGVGFAVAEQVRCDDAILWRAAVRRPAIERRPCRAPTTASPAPSSRHAHAVTCNVMVLRFAVASLLAESGSHHAWAGRRRPALRLRLVQEAAPTNRLSWHSWRSFAPVCCPPLGRTISDDHSITTRYVTLLCAITSRLCALLTQAAISAFCA